MRHRIRAAGLLVEQDRILMVHESDGGQSYWVPLVVVLRQKMVIHATR